MIVAGAGLVLGALWLWTSGASRPLTVQRELRPAGAYRPDRLSRAAASERGATASAAAAGGQEDELPPELEARLRAAAHVSAVPAPTATPGVPPSTDPLSPEDQARRQQALVGWKLQAQQVLDECVARPAAERRPVMLNVIFAPDPAPAATQVAAPAAATVRQLSPVAVSLPPPELRRLWRDTDPDELQGCLEHIRTLALPMPVTPNAVAQVPPPLMETLLVQI